MFLTFFTKRFFIISKADVLSIGAHVEKNPKTGSYKVGDRGVIELNDKTAKKYLRRYPKECEPWGKDAVTKKPPTKGKTSKPIGDRNRVLD